MGKKVKVDIEELENAIKLFDKIDALKSTGITENLIVFEKRPDFSANWDSDAGREFQGKLNERITGILETCDACRDLREYCRKVKDRAERAENSGLGWLENLVNGVVSFFDKIF